jgi:hypothetical protein
LPMLTPWMISMSANLSSEPSFSDVTVPLTVNVEGIVVVETDVVELLVVDAAVVVVELVGSEVFFVQAAVAEAITNVRTAMVYRI